MLRRILLECFGEVNAKDSAGWTKLHHATRVGRYEKCRRLVERGADLNISDEDGFAVMVAARYGHCQVSLPGQGRHQHKEQVWGMGGLR